MPESEGRLEAGVDRSPVLQGRSAILVVMALAASVAACACGRRATRPEAEVAHFPPAAGSDAGLPSWVPPDRGDWTMPAKDYASSRYSTLSDLTPSNVRGLRLAFAFPTGVDRGHEAAPLVVGGDLYVVTPYPDLLQALSLGKPEAPLRWTYAPTVAPAARGVAPYDLVNRGAAFSGGRIFFNTLDDQTVAVDSESGRELWKTRVGEVARGESLTMAPLVVRDKVLVGTSGAEFGVRGRLLALDAGSGRIHWTAYSTGPDRDVRIGPRFRPFYPVDSAPDLGTSTWPPDAWRIGGGSVDGWISYDPELHLVYSGTSAPAPWNPDQRSGDNKWTASVFARDPDTGDAIWAYQWNPHDLHGYGGGNENVLIDLTWRGARRKALVHADRNGFVYLLDRATGELLSANPYVRVTTITGIDRGSGRPILSAEKRPALGHVTRDVCPSAAGGKSGQPSAFSPRTGLLYVPYNDLCEDDELVEANYIEGTPFLGANRKMYPGADNHRGGLVAWDPSAGRRVWSVKEQFPVWSGALATAGDLVFYGTMEGWLKALDARTGALLWKFRTRSGIVG
ncbi:MAG TPA: PQQ-dependent dehydrogenase, methanol/ethanol family, partial [Thermoanaerobaculia bacterium]